MNSDPFIERKGTPASVATALARRVLPHPGGPKSSAPFGTFKVTGKNNHQLPVSYR